MAVLIESITASAQSAAPGASVTIDVTLADADAVVAIAGIRGARHSLQAPVAPGEWIVPVVAGAASGEIDQRVVSVTVQEGDLVAPYLAVEPDPFKAMFALFSFPNQAFPQGTRFDWLAGSIATSTTEPIWLVNLAGAIDNSEPFTIVPIDVTIRYPDGRTARVQRTLTMWSLYQVIRAAGQITPPVKTSGIASRHIAPQPGLFRGSFAVQNLERSEMRVTAVQYRWLDLSGEVVNPPGPPESVDLRVAPGATVTQDVQLDLSAAPAGSTACLIHYSGISGDLPVYFEVGFDLHSTKPIAIREVDRYRTVWPPDDIIVWGREELWKINPEIYDEAEGLTTHGLWVLDRMAAAADQLQEGPISGRHVAPRSRRITLHTVMSRVRDTLFSRAEDVATRFQFANLQPRRFRVPTRQFVDRGITVGSLLGGEHLDTWHTWDIATLPLGGGRCDPDHLPDNVPANLACQFTGQYEEKMLPHRVMNAEKGDIFLSPGGPGVVAGLLRQVSPAQKYSHMGICTKNRLELCHATGADGWLEEQHSGGVWSPPFGSEPAPSDGFDPNALKYIWPGGIIQDIEQAMVGSEFQGPDGKPYKLSCLGQSSIAQFGEKWEIVPAIIVKPHPHLETPEVRETLHAVADAARAMCITADESRAGQFAKLHYRFFHYTDATIADPAPSSAGWAAGTFPAVCSSLPWIAAKQAGVQHFEGGQLEPEDLQAGAELRSGIPDGLYHYTAEERAAAGNWLYSYYIDKVTKELDEKTGGSAIGTIWETFSDIADDIANQVLNTFAHDWSDVEAKDSERWKDEPRQGTAVSPDDIMRWDGPDKGGLWGTVVGMDYRPARPEKVGVYAWRETTGPGTLVGHVRFHGEPAVGADIRVNGRDLNTDAGGNFTIQLLEGAYLVEAGMHVEGVGYVEAKEPVNVVFNDTVEATITLQEPPDVYRRLVIKGEGMLRDDETWTEDEVEAVGFVRTLDVQPWASHAEHVWSEGVGDEVLTELKFTADLQFDRSVVVRADGTFWEGDDEEREDQEMAETWTFTIQPGETQVHRIYLWNKDEDTPGDNLDLMLSLTNDRQP